MGSPTEAGPLAELQRQVATLEQRQRQLTGLLDAAQVVTSSLELDEILQTVAQQAARISGAVGVRLFLLDEEAGVLRCRVAVGLTPEEIETLVVPLAQGFSGQVAATGTPLNVPDIRRDPRVLRPHIAAKYGHVSYLGLPIARDSRGFGVLAFSTPAPRVYGAEEIASLSLFTRQAAIALENARLHATAVRRGAELEALLRATRSLMSGLDLQAILDRLVVEAARISGTPHVKLLLVERATGVLRAMAIHGQTAMPAGFELALGVGRSGIVAATGQPLFSDVSADDPRNAPFAEEDRRLGLVTYLGLPIKIRDEVLGVLTFNTTEPRRYSAVELAYLTSFADQAALAIENAGFFEATRRALAEKTEAESALRARTRQLDAVRAVSQEVTRELDLGTLLQLITRRAIELVGTDAGTVYLWDEREKLLIPRAWHGYGDWRGEERLRLGEGVVGAVAERREGLVVNEYRTSRYAVPLFLERTQIASVLAEPLLYQDRLLGVIGISNHGTSRSFTPEDRELLSLFAAPAAIAIENARLYADLQRTNRELQQAQEGLVRSEKLRALGQMAAGITHDLNNMLAAILGQVELIRLRAPDPGVQAALRTLETSATDGAYVVRRLQDFARQRAASPLQPTALPPIVTEALDITRPRWEDEAQRRGAVVRVVTDLADCPPILGHAAEVREALANLILNALDAMPQGGTLTLRARAVGPSTGQPGGEEAGAGPLPDRPLDTSTRAVELRVTDTGVGMSEETRQRIFEPFFTTKGLHGSGLGLSVVYGVVERHGGQIEVHSAPGKGATFVLRFRAAAAGPAAPAAAPSPWTAGLRLLLIDDDPAVRETVASLLRASGHEVVEAGGGAEGLARLADLAVDCVLTDLGMPEVTGWEVAKAAKARNPALPVILLTGWGEQPGGEAAPRGLVDRILGKPFRLEDLLRALVEVTLPG